MTQQGLRERSLAHWAAVNVAEWRKNAGLSQEGLAAKISALGVPMTRSKVANLESRRRGDLTLDELAAFAAALNVRVPDLLTPPDLTEDVEVMPEWTVSGFSAVSWLEGEEPLLTKSADGYDWHGYFRHAPPGVRAKAEVQDREAWRAIQVLQVDVLHALHGVSDEHRGSLEGHLKDDLRRVAMLVNDLADNLEESPAGAGDVAWKPQSDG